MPELPALRYCGCAVCPCLAPFLGVQVGGESRCEDCRTEFHLAPGDGLDRVQR